jgi:hypothetical protein
MSSVDGSSGARYAISFNEQLFGGKCDVEIVIDLATCHATSALSMGQFLSSRPAFSISLENLKLFARGLADIKNHARLLTARLPGATEHQLNCTVGGATAIVVHPAEKPPRFNLTIGRFHREGLFEELPIGEIQEAIAKIQALQDQVVGKVAGEAAAQMEKPAKAT